jgi:hypothetical protein
LESEPIRVRVAALGIACSCAAVGFEAELASSSDDPPPGSTAIHQHEFPTTSSVAPSGEATTAAPTPTPDPAPVTSPDPATPPTVTKPASTTA